MRDGALVPTGTGACEVLSFNDGSSLAGSERADVLITEGVQLQDIDRIFVALADVWRPALDYPSSEVDSAALWALLRTGQANLVVGHDAKHYVAASAWRFERWAQEIVFRCFSHIGMHARAEQWLPDFLELAKATAKVGGATRIIWEASAPSSDATPDAFGFTPLRRTLTMEV